MNPFVVDTMPESDSSSNSVFLPLPALVFATLDASRVEKAGVSAAAAVIAGNDIAAHSLDAL
jgi:hypothetical protein